MDKKKAATHFTEVHFHAPVGQYIDYIENQTVSFDKDMNMHIAHVENLQPAPKADEPYSPPVPREGDYNGVRLYIEERKKYDPDFKTFCQNHNRKDLCSLLTKQFGWYVDDNSLCQNIRRNM